LGLDWPGGALALLQFIISAAAPIAVAAVALLLLSRRSAWWALIVSSLYFPFIDYAGYLLAEGYIILLIPLVLMLFLLAMRPKRWPWAAVLGVVTGLIWCIGIAFKLVLLPGMLCFGAVYVLLYESGIPAARRWLVVAAIIVALLPGMAWLSARATRGTGRWCLVSNKDGADFLLGHYGHIRSIEWRDPTGQESFHFGSPSAVQRGFTGSRVVHFPMTDSKSNWREAGAWIRANPGQAVVLSVEHVYDIFVTGVPWPTSETEFWPLAEGFHFVFVALLLIPSIFLLVIVALRRGLWAMLRGPEFLILSPIFGVIAAVFMTTGELRYRIPWDAAFILLAIEFYSLVHRVMYLPEAPPEVPPGVPLPRDA
jgi:4-amino-4-deoxy-L-arabinose transferase-like glycosyltransferase